MLFTQYVVARLFAGTIVCTTDVSRPFASDVIIQILIVVFWPFLETSHPSAVDDDDSTIQYYYFKCTGFVGNTKQG